MPRQTLARIAALFYALNFVLGTLAFMWAGQGRTEAADQMTLFAAIDYAIVAVLLGKLFEPAGRALSWTVAAIGLVGCALSAGDALHWFETPMNPLAIFGLYCLGLGALVFRSAMLPRWIGVLLMLGGMSWLTFALPSVARDLAPYNIGPGFIAELVFTLWLLIFGVRERAPVSVSPQTA